MSNPKERHYWAQLRAALTAGQWKSPVPAKTPNGTPLTWSELFRKFNKHCRGYQDVAEVASQTHALALLLSAESPNEDEDNDDFGKPPLDLGRECLLPEERIEDATVGYEVLKSLESSNYDTIVIALAYYAYALGNPAQCIAHLQKVPELLQFQNHIPTVGSSRSSTNGLLAPSNYAPSTTSFTGSFTSIVDTTVPEVRDGRGWAMAETFRSLCLQGMANEQLHPSDPHKALKAYCSASCLFPSLKSEFNRKSLPKSSGKLDFVVFFQLRELWRWVERLLWRAVVLTSRTSNIQKDHDGEDSLWMWLSHYIDCSSCWPSNFRTSHRSTIASLHLRALVLRHGTLSPSVISLKKSPVWLHAARSAVQDYRAILNVSTQFPSAGQQNTKVEEFADLCVAVWEASGAVGEQAGWVIDILWWATRLTFNSSRILRHMTRLLHLSGDTPLAKRTLRLYIQVVGKAYEASKEGVGEDKDTDEYWVETLVFGARMLCKFASSSPGLEGLEDVQEAGVVIEKARTRLDTTNARLMARVQLAEGIHKSLLAMKGQEPLTRTQHLFEAHALFLLSVQTQPTPSGYYHLALSFASQGPAHDLKQAIEYSGLAVESDPNEVRYWHLLGLLLTSLEKWKEAVEILEHGADLCSVGVEDAELEVGPRIEVGSEVENETEDGDRDTVGDTGTIVQEDDVRTVTIPGPGRGVQAKDFAPKRQGDNGTNGTVPHSNGDANGTRLNGASTVSSSSSSIDTMSPTSIYLLDESASELPPASTLLKSGMDKHPPSKQELFEYHLQLRMTQVALTEVIEGPEGAELQWLEIFSWIADQKGLAGSAEPATRQSIDGTRVSMDHSLNPPASETSHRPHTHTLDIPVGNQVYQHHANTNGSGSANHTSTTDSLLSPPPIPIMIVPATPEGELLEKVAMRDHTSLDKERHLEKEREKGSEKEKDHEKEKEKEKKGLNGLRAKRSTSIDRDSKLDPSKPKKKVGQMLKHQVHKGRTEITAISRKIGHGVVKNKGLRRSTSTPDFHAVFQQTSYQASSIHSRRRLSSIIHSSDRTPTESPPPPPPPSIPPSATQQDFKLKNDRSSKENRLLSDLWLMSAATFRRLGKLDQAKGSIQEAEVKDDNNPAVWVQLGLYYVALGLHQHAVDTFQKALFIAPDDVAATVHLSRLYLDPEINAKLHPAPKSITVSNSTTTTTSPSQFSISGEEEEEASLLIDVDLAAGMLAYLTKGKGWDVPEAWYYLAKAYGMQGRKEKERETLKLALGLSERRGVRDVGWALGWCI
ncbi:hypothetical protein B0H34DRAFT_724464 [Crassisporium funariophilum]|nr:hypothetical protein B0H34DRAFT_724464 [Crassisporium funariophilum]